MEQLRDNKNVFSNRVIAYLIIMLIGIMMRTYVTHTITIVWIINLVGLAMVFFPYFRYTEPSVLKIGIAYIVFGAVTIAINAKYMSMNAKSIGTNINIFILPVFFNIIMDVKRRHLLDENCLQRILRFISFAGIIAIVCSIVFGYRDIISVFQGMNAYRANVGGIFYSKNIYGAFVSLTMVADLYFLSKEGGPKNLALTGIKLLAVILSFSRAALLQIGIMLFVFIWNKKKRTLKDFLALIALIIFALAVIAYIKSNDRLIDFVMNSVLRLDNGDAGRQMLREQAISRVDQGILTTIFGVGYAGIDYLGIDVDNTYLYLIFSGGLIKVAFFLFFEVFSFIKIFALKRKNDVLSRLCMAVAVSYLAFAYFESVAFLELGLLNFLYTFFLFLFPICYSSSEAVKEEELN